MKLVVGNYNYSTWSMRPWLFIDYHQLPIEINQTNLFTEETLTMLSGHFSDGKVPLLVDGNTEVWDSIAILEYLGEKFPQTNPWPSDAQVRAVARSVSAEMHSSFNALRYELPMNCRRFYPDFQLSEAGQSDVRRIFDIWSYCREKFGSSGPWLFGDFSIADAMYAPVIMRFRSATIEMTNVAEDYCETMNACPSVKKWISQGLAEDEVVKEDELEQASRLLTC